MSEDKIIFSIPEQDLTGTRQKAAIHMNVGARPRFSNVYQQAEACRYCSPSYISFVFSTDVAAHISTFFTVQKNSFQRFVAPCRRGCQSRKRLCQTFYICSWRSFAYSPTDNKDLAAIYIQSDVALVADLSAVSNNNSAL